MVVNFPANCNKPSSRWSFSLKLMEVLRLHHNASCAGMAAEQAVVWRKNNYNSKSKAVIQGRLTAQSNAVNEKYWNAKIPDHVSGGVLTYPAGLNQSNEGSRASFLLDLEQKLREDGRDMEDPDVEAVNVALGQAKQDAKDGIYWNPQLSDIS